MDCRKDTGKCLDIFNNGVVVRNNIELLKNRIFEEHWAYISLYKW